MSGFAVVLAAADASEQSDRAVEVARDLALVSGGTVHLFHVLERQVIVGKSGGAFEMETADDVETLLERELATLRASGAKVQPHVRRGRHDEVAQSILELADELSADVVVMGTRGKSAFAALVVGSNAYKVLHSSQRPVLLVP